MPSIMNKVYYWGFRLFATEKNINVYKSSTRGHPTVTYRRIKSTRGKIITTTHWTTAKERTQEATEKEKPPANPSDIREVNGYSSFRRRRFILNLNVYTIIMIVLPNFTYGLVREIVSCINIYKQTGVSFLYLISLIQRGRGKSFVERSS